MFASYIISLNLSWNGGIVYNIGLIYNALFKSKSTVPSTPVSCIVLTTDSAHLKQRNNPIGKYNGAANQSTIFAVELFILIQP